MGKPAQVRAAMFSGDTTALSAMGRAGGRASARKRRDKAFRIEAFAMRKAEEIDEIIAERGGDPDD